MTIRTDRTNRHNSTNGEEWENLREYGRVRMVGEFLAVREVGSSMEEI